MSDTAWAHLPNAKHIDAVLAYTSTSKPVWGTSWDIVWGPVRDLAWSAALFAVAAQARTTTHETAWTLTWRVKRRTEQIAARSVAWHAINALIAWDSSADLLDCTPDVLRAMIDLAEPPVRHQAALLLPYAIVRSNAKQEVT